MRKLLACLPGLMVALAGLAHAQTSQYGGIRESTDPQRAEEIEKKARQISGQSTSETGATGTAPEAKTDAKKATDKKKKKRTKSHKKFHKHKSSKSSTSTESPGSTETKPDQAQPAK